tara:strand:- start:1828 stop:2277 length:450 start_codon:yes stop_codon:yes gene_type:complete
MSVRRICFKTNFGFISIKEENEKVISINFKKSNNLSPNKLLFRLKKNINEFFKKNIKNIKCPTRIIGNKNQKKVWHEIKKIKYGKTKSYKQIAKKVKLHPRYVGKICSQNKLLLIIPCHRVIRTDGTLGGFSANGGLKLKRKLIQFEKI